MKNTIEQVQRVGAQQLDAPIRKFLQNYYPNPSSRRLMVSLFDESGRKKRCSASSENWSPESGEIRIKFEPVGSTPEVAVAGAMMPESNGMMAVAGTPEASSEAKDAASGRNEKLAQLLNALDRAEATPGWNFVPLRKFRDEILSAEVPTLATDAERHGVLDLAIKRRLVLVGKVPNPKTPQFPVTSVRLNRLMLEVKTILGQENDEDLDFHPVEIRGEPMSETIIRERREQ